MLHQETVEVAKVKRITNGSIIMQTKTRLKSYRRTQRQKKIIVSENKHKNYEFINASSTVGSFSISL